MVSTDACVVGMQPSPPAPSPTLASASVPIPRLPRSAPTQDRVASQPTYSMTPLEGALTRLWLPPVNSPSVSLGFCPTLCWPCALDCFPSPSRVLAALGFTLGSRVSSLCPRSLTSWAGAPFVSTTVPLSHLFLLPGLPPLRDNT